MVRDAPPGVSAESPAAGSEAPSAAVSGAERRAEHLVGSTVGGTYRVVRRIGSGGIGHVYEAEHMRLGNRVALKVLRAELGDRPLTLGRFRREAKILAAIESDHVVRVLDCGELPDGAPYFTMELLRGDDLRTRLSHVGRLSEGSALRVALQACRGLAAVHAAGVIHRDLKPANLFLSQHAEDGERCRILDFGVAKALAASDVTREGTGPGTLRYMAPEQVLQSAKPDARTDIYALGAILYEMLTGAPPHDGETAEELMFAIANRTPIPPHVVNSDVRTDVSAAVLRCLSRSPGDRFQSAGELIEALKSLSKDDVRVGGSASALDATLPERTLDADRLATRQRPSGRPRMSFLGGVLLGSVLGLGTWSVLHPRAVPPPEALPAAAPARNATKLTPSTAPATLQEKAPGPMLSARGLPSASPSMVPPAPSFPPRPAKTRNSTASRPSEFGDILHQESPYGSGP